MGARQAQEERVTTRAQEERVTKSMQGITHVRASATPRLADKLQVHWHRHASQPTKTASSSQTLVSLTRGQVLMRKPSGESGIRFAALALALPIQIVTEPLQNLLKNRYG